MNFNSLAFLIFLPCVLTVWRGCPQKLRWIVLLLASCIFYAWYNVLLLVPILVTTMVSYFAAIWIYSACTTVEKKTALVVTLTVCLGILFVFKYLDFTISIANAIISKLRLQASFSKLDLILPMGISFYTFQTLSYVIDVYKGTIQPEKHFGYYSLYVVFFPQLVAGPIERPHRLIPQLKKAANPKGVDVADGVRRMIIGFIKKIAIADVVAPYVDKVYSSTEAQGSVYIAATLLFAVQIYCDFSGYTDIAIGCADLMGIKLSENFKHPYFSSNIKEFWKRWHISLSSWLTDYVYIPLGGSRKGIIRQCLNTLIVFLLSGLWHGASLTFLVWGGLHGVYLIIYILYQRALKATDARSTLNKLISQTVTFCAVCFAWIFFRAETLQDAGRIIITIFTDFSFGIDAVLIGMGMKNTELIMLAFVISLLLLVERIPKYRVQETPLMRAKEQTCTALIYFIAILVIATVWHLALVSGNIGNFIYFSF